MASEAQEHAQAMARQAQEQAHGLLQKLQEHKPTSSQILGFLTFVAIAGLILFLGGLALSLLAPVLIFLSPVLVPVGFLLFFCTAGALVAGGFGVAVLSAVSWIYNYMKGRHPPGSDQVDHARDRIQDAAEQVRRKARDLASSLQSTAAEAAPGA
eukprot:c25725_g1_i1 orf=80-544(-)